MVEIEQPGQETSEQRWGDGEEIDEVARQRIDRWPVDDRRFPGIAGEPAGIEDCQQHDGGHRQRQADEQLTPLQDARAEIGDRGPLRHGECVGAEQPDQIGQHQDDDHEQRIERVERHQHAPPPHGGNGKSGEHQQHPGRGRRRQQQQPGLDRPGEPRIAPVLADQLPGMQQKQRPQRARQHQRAELDAGRAERHHRQREQYREHRLLPADDRAGQLIIDPEGDDGAGLRQQIDTEHVVAGGAESDVGEPERQRRTEPGSDLVFPSEGQRGGKVARRTAVEQHRQDQPKSGLGQHHDPDHQPRPGADQFDNERGEAHETSECQGRAALSPGRLIERSSRRGNRPQIVTEISEVISPSTVKRSGSTVSWAVSG